MSEHFDPTDPVGTDPAGPPGREKVQAPAPAPAARPIPPPPFKPVFHPDELLEAVKESHPDHTAHKAVGGGQFTALNPTGQTVIFTDEVAHRLAAALYGAV